MFLNTAVYRARPEAVAEEKWQKPTFVSSLAHPVSLHDIVVPTDDQYPSDDQFIESMKLWKLAHTIPCPISVGGGFTEDGITVELKFHAEFFNVLLIQVNVTYPSAVYDVKAALSCKVTMQTLIIQPISSESISRSSSTESLCSSISSSSIELKTGCSSFLFKIERLQRLRVRLVSNIFMASSSIPGHITYRVIYG
jgi:hypothetical protein